MPSMPGLLSGGAELISLQISVRLTFLFRMFVLYPDQLVCLVLPQLYCEGVLFVVPPFVLLFHQMGRGGDFFCGGPERTEIGPMLVH